MSQKLTKEYNPCHCPAYKFPHRRESGKCSGDYSFCSTCGQPAMGKWIDMGIGTYEYWGATGVDVNNCFLSECCEMELTRWDGIEIDAKCPQ